MMTDCTSTQARELADRFFPRDGSAPEMLRALADQVEALTNNLVFVERWAVHHAAKPHMTAAQALGVIAHYPAIRAITKSYVDGYVPETFDPYAEIEKLTAERETFLAAGRVLSKVTQEFIELTAERDVLSAVVASYERVGIVSHDGMNAKVGWTKPVRHNTMLFAVKDPK